MICNTEYCCRGNRQGKVAVRNKGIETDKGVRKKEKKERRQKTRTELKYKNT